MAAPGCGEDGVPLELCQIRARRFRCLCGLLHVVVSLFSPPGSSDGHQALSRLLRPFCPRQHGCRHAVDAHVAAGSRLRGHPRPLRTAHSAASLPVSFPHYHGPFPSSSETFQLVQQMVCLLMSFIVTALALISFETLRQIIGHSLDMASTPSVELTAAVVLGTVLVCFLLAFLHVWMALVIYRSALCTGVPGVSNSTRRTGLERWPSRVSTSASRPRSPLPPPTSSNASTGHSTAPVALLTAIPSGSSPIKSLLSLKQVREGRGEGKGTEQGRKGLTVCAMSDESEAVSPAAVQQR